MVATKSALPPAHNQTRLAEIFFNLLQLKQAIKALPMNMSRSFRVIFCIALLSFVLPARADEFFLSYWCGPPAGPDVERHYAEVAECHFNYAMIPCSGNTPEQVNAALSACGKHGLKYVLYDSRLMARGPADPGFATNLDAVISEYSNRPGMGGYFLADEPGPGSFPLLGAVNQYLLKKDPGHLPFINLLPNHAPGWALGTSNYEEHVERYLTTVKPKLLSFDQYALLNNDTEAAPFFDNLEIIRRQGLKHHVPFAYIFLVTPHGPYRDPGEAELRWQANAALVYGARGLLYFTYWMPDDKSYNFHDAIINMDGSRTPHYEMAKAINSELVVLGKVLMKLTSLNVCHTGKIPSGCKGMDANSPLKVEDGTFVIGLFRHEDGSAWAMVVNRDMRNSRVAALAFDKKVTSLRQFNVKNGRLNALKVRDHKAAISLPAGGAVLMKLESGRILQSPKAAAENVHNSMGLKSCRLKPVLSFFQDDVVGKNQANQLYTGVVGTLFA